MKKLMALRTQHYLFVEGYDPRIHALFFLPRLYKSDNDDRLGPPQGEEIGICIAQAPDHRTPARRRWYNPLEKLPEEPVIGGKS